MEVTVQMLNMAYSQLMRMTKEPLNMNHVQDTANYIPLADALIGMLAHAARHSIAQTAIVKCGLLPLVLQFLDTSMHGYVKVQESALAFIAAMSKDNLEIAQKILPDKSILCISIH